MNSLPIISLSELVREQSNNPEIQKLYDVCDEHGFFYLKEHGVSGEIINKTIEASRRFFELPEDIKLNYRQDIQTVYPKTARGYVPLYGEILNEKIGLDPKEVFDLGIERPLSEQPFTGPTMLSSGKIVGP
ncbi:MAG: isopenicillin N synthase family oxygenase, partial [Symploca sp. SIO2E6]|nr:isopenicillin N synthase family oxygenase [Symploca sp. SIO2E6]